MFMMRSVASLVGCRNRDSKMDVFLFFRFFEKCEHKNKFCEYTLFSLSLVNWILHTEFLCEE